MSILNLLCVLIESLQQLAGLCQHPSDCRPTCWGWVCANTHQTAGLPAGDGFVPTPIRLLAYLLGMGLWQHPSIRLQAYWLGMGLWQHPLIRLQAYQLGMGHWLLAQECGYLEPCPSRRSPQHIWCSVNVRNWASSQEYTFQDSWP